MIHKDPRKAERRWDPEGHRRAAWHESWLSKS